MRHERGQAGVEYVAIVAVVAVVLAVATALLPPGAPEMPGRVAAQLRHALCVVTGRVCAPPARLRALEPCPLRRSEEAQEASARVAVVELGAGRRLEIEERSDGSAAVTMVDGGTAGVGVGVGAHVSIGRRAGAVEGRASGTLRFASGREWHFGSVREAERFVARYRQSFVADTARRVAGAPCAWVGLRCPWGPRRLPDPDVRFDEDAGEAVASIAGFGTQARAGLSRAVGMKRHRDGARTFYVRLRREASGSLEGLFASGSGAAEDEGLVALDVGRDGVPRRLEITTARAAGGSLQATAGRHALDTGARGPAATETLDAVGGRIERATATGGAVRGRRVEAVAALDLEHPEARRAAERFFAAVNGTPFAMASPSAALRTLIDRDGTDALRQYDTRSESGGAEAGIAAGGRLGGGYRTSATRSTLTAAYTRLPAVGFAERYDCVT